MQQVEPMSMEDITKLLDELPDEQRKIVRDHAAMLRRYIELGGPLCILAFTLVSIEFVASEIAAQEKA